MGPELVQPFFEGYREEPISGLYTQLNVVRALVDGYQYVEYPGNFGLSRLDMQDDALDRLNNTADEWYIKYEDLIEDVKARAVPLVESLHPIETYYDDYRSYLSQIGVNTVVLDRMDTVFRSYQFSISDDSLESVCNSSENSIDISSVAIYETMLENNRLLGKYEISVPEPELFSITYREILSHELSHLLQGVIEMVRAEKGIDPDEIGIPLLLDARHSNLSAIQREDIRISIERFAEGISLNYLNNYIVSHLPVPELERENLYQDILNKGQARADLTYIMRKLRENNCSWGLFKKIAYDRLSGSKTYYGILRLLLLTKVPQMLAYRYPFSMEELSKMISQTNQVIGLAA